MSQRSKEAISLNTLLTSTTFSDLMLLCRNYVCEDESKLVRNPIPNMILEIEEPDQSVASVSTGVYIGPC